MSGRGHVVVDWLRWAASAVLVLGAHAAAAAIIVTIADPVPAGVPAAAIMVDLAPISAAPENAQPDVAPGPVQPQIDGTPDVKPEQVAETPVEPVVAQEPVETPVPDKPIEVAVARIEPIEETIETPPEQKPQDQPLIEKAPEAKTPEVTATLPVAKPPPQLKRKKAASRPTQLATAPMPAPQIDTRAVAPSQGMPSPNARQAVADWNQLVIAAIRRSTRYPSEARSRNEVGRVQVTFAVNRQGHLVSSRVTRSSGFAILDQEALLTIQRAQPFPPVPPDITGSRIERTTPVNFILD